MKLENPNTRRGQFRDLTAIRRERAQANLVAIYRVGYKSVVVMERPERVAYRIAELERLNPGRHYEVR